MRLLHVISSLGPGGAQKTLTSICSTSTSTEHIVFPLVLKQDAIPLDGIPSVRSVRNRPSLAWGTLHRLIREISKIIEHDKPDILIAWMYHSAVLVALATLGVSHKPKVIWMVRQESPLGATRNIVTMALVAVSGLISRFSPDRVVYVTKQTAHFHEKFLGYPKGKRGILENAHSRSFADPKGIRAARLVDSSRFRDGTLFPQDKLVLGVLTRPRKRLRWRPLLIAIRRLSEEHGANFKLVIRGIEDVPQWLRTPKTGSVDIVVQPWSPDVAPFYSSIDILVHIGAAEGMSNTILEATASGLPVIALQSEINRKTTNESVSLITKYSSPNIVAAVKNILTLRASGHLQNVLDEAAARSLENFSFARFSLKYHQLLFTDSKTAN